MEAMGLNTEGEGSPMAFLRRGYKARGAAAWINVPLLWALGLLACLIAARPRDRRPRAARSPPTLPLTWLACVSLFPLPSSAAPLLLQTSTWWEDDEDKEQSRAWRS